MPTLRIADVVSANLNELRELANQDFPDAVLHFVYAQGVSPGSAARVKQALLTHGIDIEDLRVQHAAPELRSVASLLSAGWSKSLIERYLGAPDVFKNNHHFSGAARVRYYNAKRVAAVESRPAVVEALKTAAKRVEAGFAAAESRRVALLERVAELPVIMEVVDPEELVADAITTYQENAEDLEYARNGQFDWIPVTDDADPDFIEKIQVEHIMQKLSNYDQASFAIAGQPGAEDARVALRTKFLEAIAARYPHLGEEVERQLRWP